MTIATATMIAARSPVARMRRARLFAGVSLTLLGCMPAVAHAGDPLPSGGVVTSGTATISSSGNSVSVNQGSDRAIINWKSFSVGQGDSVTFNQPNATSATLNRVTGAATSTIAGQINSNGAVYLINPNGIAITGTGVVRTAGGFIASTLDIADADFTAGKLAFAGNGASARVGNAGTITAGKGAYVALLGGSVSNSGTISVPLGSVGLGSGEQIGLDINGGHFMQVAIPTSAITTGSDALIDMPGTITVTGGRVVLSAASVKNAVRNIINMSGTISADSAVGSAGSITLLGGDGGTVTASGSLSARATGATGDGGFVETSGSHVALTGLRVTTGSARGTAGTWLIDPVDFTIAPNGGDITGAQLTNSLATGNVVIRSSQGASGTNGNIVVNDGVNWSANTLTLDAYKDINVNAVMSASGTASFVGVTGDTAGNGISTGGALNMALDDSGFSGRLDLASTARFTLNNTAYVVITSLGAAGSTTGTDLQGMNGALTSNYVLGANIDASATSGWNGGSGFTPIGTDGAGTVLNGGYGLTGNVNGLGHTITALFINRPTADDVGLIGYSSGNLRPTIRNIATINSNITGGYFVGSLGGKLIDLFNNYSTGTVSGSRGVGGLSGVSSTITNSWSGAAVQGTSFVGGLVGQSSRVTDSHASGNVTGASNDIDGFVGGLVGSIDGSINRSYTTGNVSGSVRVGGVVGYANTILNYTDIEISQVYSTGNVTGNSYIGGIIGSSQSNSFHSIQDASASGLINGVDLVGGIAGYFSGSITNALFTGTASASTNKGAIVGMAGSYQGNSSVNYATFPAVISHSYWDSSKAGLSNAVGAGSATGTTLTDVTGYTTAQLQDYTTRSSIYQGWDFVNIWIPPNQAGQMGIAQAYYPTLRFAQKIVVAIDSFTRPYGQANPTLTYTLTGLRAGDTLTTAPTLYTSATTNSPVGTYAITGSGALVSYAGGTTGVRYVNGTLTIGKLALVALGGTVGKTYDGTTSATLTSGNYILSGFATGEGATINQTVGTYATANVGTGILVTVNLAPSNFVANAGTDLSNYTLPTSVSGAVGTITPAPLTVTYLANLATSIYGTTPGGLSGTYAATGLLGNDTLASALGGTPLFTTTATSASSVGSYAVTGTGVTSTNGNYTIVGTQAARNATALTITPRALTLTPGTLTGIYGNAPPTSSSATDTSTATNSGLVNGDTVSGITGTAASFGRGLAANYSITYTTAANALTITPRPISISANAATRLFGLSDPTFTYTIGGNGLVNGDTLSGNLSSTATSQSIPGLYAINQGTLAASANYTITGFTPGTLTILPGKQTQDCYVASAVGGENGGGASRLCAVKSDGASSKPMAPIVIVSNPLSPAVERRQ